MFWKELQNRIGVSRGGALGSEFKQTESGTIEGGKDNLEL